MVLPLVLEDVYLTGGSLSGLSGVARKKTSTPEKPDKDLVTTGPIHILLGLESPAQIFHFLSTSPFLSSFPRPGGNSRRERKERR
jgi:hypothetical protein